MKKIICCSVFFLCAGVQAQTILLQETFNSGTLPAGWVVDSAGQTPVNGWVFIGQPGVPAGNGFDNNYVRIFGDVTYRFIDCYLITSSLDASSVNKLFLSYTDQLYHGFASGIYGYGFIDISIDNGITWHQIFKSYSPHYPKKRNVIDVTSIAAGQSNVKFRFHYIEHDLGGWAIDSIVVTDSVPCTSPPDSGFAVTDDEFVCTGSPAKLWLDDLVRGIGQTYQWQLNNAATGNLWSNVPGAVSDTLNITQNGSTYYRCEITCGGLSTNSAVILLPDTPSAIDAYSDNIHLCAGRDDTLRLSSPYGGAGIGYQWQWSSTGNDPYFDITGATYDTCIISTASYTNSTYFKCKQVCLSNSASRAGFWVNEVPNPHTLCYCYPFNNNTCGNNYYISHFEINSTTLNNNTSCIDTLVVHWNNNNYQFFDPSAANTTATLVSGQTYTLNITSTNADQYIGMWIDYNLDTNFDPSEYTNLGKVLNNTPAQVQFTVPTLSNTGLTGLRLRSRKFYPIDSTNVCGTVVGGTTHDYIVTLDSTVGIWDLGFQILDLRLSPNPTKGEVTISSYYTIQNLSILNTNAAIVFEKKNINSFNEKINTVQLTNGVYMVKAETSRGMSIKKLVVMKE